MNVGILGVGTYLPETIRTNDWWSPEVVASWAPKGPPRPHPAPTTPGERAVMAAMADYRADPFHGSKSRHVIDDGMDPSELGIRAAREALAKARVDPEEIDLLLVHASVPDYLATNVACTIHAALGMKPSCVSLAVEAACNSFQTTAELASDRIRAGRAKKALLVQWCAVTRLLPPGWSHAPWFGDGAGAVVLGEVAEGYGLLGSAHRTDGSLQNTLVVGVPGCRWYDQGKAILYPEDFERAKTMFIRTADMASEVVNGALDDAGLKPADVDFYACHQGTVWLRRVTQEHAGIGHARSCDTYERTGNLGSPNIPMVLAEAERAGLLNDGDVVATHAGGSGITYASLVLRWGTGE